jgi:hypothetical protein
MLVEGNAPMVSNDNNANTYDKSYYLADGMYLD